MKKSQSKVESYIFSTSVDYSANDDEFIVELFLPEDIDEIENEQPRPKKVIHNFDELISFFENLDQNNSRKFTIKKNKLSK